MQNKGYSTPYGNTVIPNTPPVVTGNGIPEGQGPSGSASVIPGAIGVAGPRARELHEHFKVENTRIEGVMPRIPTIAEAMGQGMLDGALDGLIKLLADRLAPRIADLVATRVIAKISELGERALGAANAGQADEAMAAIRKLEADTQLATRQFVQPAGMVAGSAAGIRDRVEQGIKTAATNAVGIPPTQVAAYSYAHRELAVAVSHYGIATVGEISQGFQILRTPPDPPVFALTAKNGVQSTWTVYSAAYDQPRFRLAMSPGVLPADRFLVVLDGRTLGYVMQPHLLAAMSQWLMDNIEPIQEPAPVESGS